MLMNAGKKSVGGLKSKRSLWMAAAVILTVLVVSAGSWAMWRSYSKQKVLASIGDDPRRIRQAVEEGQISRDEAREAFMEAMEARMNRSMDEFFVLPAGKERDAYLDRMIDEMEARRREWQERSTTQPTTRPNWAERRGDGPATQPSDADRAQRAQRAAQRADSTPPERRAQRAEFMSAMQKRMAERGIQPGRGGPGGWGGRGGGGGGGGPRGAGGNR
jgi:uncharacterized membrane protein YgcG